MEPENNKVYVGTELFDDYLQVKERFQYGNVWTQQAKDVHPPFYYAVIHTVCSFFPGRFSLWFGLLPNFLFLIVIDIMLYRLAKLFLHSEALALIAVVINGLSVMTMNMVIFIRMYAMLTAIVLALVYLLVKYMDQKKDMRFWIGLYAAAVIGTMTQYYFLILLFFLCLFQLGIFLHRRGWKDICRFIAALALAGLTCICIFPSMLDQIFGNGYRGVEAKDNLLSASLHDWLGGVIEYTGIITRELFGGHVVGVLFFLLIGGYLLYQRKMIKQLLHETKAEEWMLLFATVCYILIIMKIAPYRTDRYVMCVGWCMLLLVIDLIYRIVCMTKLEWKQRSVYIFIGGLFLCLNVLSMAYHGWSLPYAYLGTTEKLMIFEEYREYPAVFVCDGENAPSYSTNYCRELPSYASYSFVGEQEASTIIADRNEEKLVLYVDVNVDADKVLSQIADQAQGQYNAHFIDKYYMTNIYFLEKI